jgi:HTH-type transcriptional regulator/antitoxin MqsA
MRPAVLEFAGREEQYQKRYLECDHCMAIRTPAEAAKCNALEINDAKLRALGAPSRAELKKMRASWKLTQGKAGKIFGVGPTAFSKYENGEVVPAAPTARLLFLACHDDKAIPLLAEHCEVELAAASKPATRERSAGVVWPTGFNPEHLHMALTVLHPSTGVTGTMYLGSTPVSNGIQEKRR